MVPSSWSLAEVDNEGNIWLAGHTSGSLDNHVNAGDADAFLMMFDSSGAHQWTSVRGTSGVDQAYGVQALLTRVAIEWLHVAP